MLLTAFLLTLSSVLAQSGTGTPSLPASQNLTDGTPSEKVACEVLSNPEAYVGLQFTFRGVLTSYEHGMYFSLYPNCAKQKSVRAENFPMAEYRHAGGEKNLGVRGMITGEISLRTIPANAQKKRGPHTVTVLTVKHISDLKLMPQERK